MRTQINQPRLAITTFLCALAGVGSVITACSASRTGVRTVPNPHHDAADHHVELTWELRPEPENAEDPTPHTSVAIIVRGANITRAELGTFKGNCWTDKQGWQKAPAGVITSVQCVYIGAGTNIHVARAGATRLVVRRVNVDDADPTPTFNQGETLEMLDLPADVTEVRLAETSP